MEYEFILPFKVKESGLLPVTIVHHDFEHWLIIHLTTVNSIRPQAPAGQHFSDTGQLNLNQGRRAFAIPAVSPATIRTAGTPSRRPRGLAPIGPPGFPQALPAGGPPGPPPQQRPQALPPGRLGPPGAAIWGPWGTIF